MHNRPANFWRARISAGRRRTLFFQAGLAHLPVPKESDAISARLDCAVLESGMPRAGALAARSRDAAGNLQQLWRSAPQCASAARAPVPDAAAAARKLSANWQTALGKSVLCGSSQFPVSGGMPQYSAVSNPNPLCMLRKRGAAGGGSRPLGAWVMEESGTEAVSSLESNAIVPLASERVDRTPVQFVLEPRYYPAEQPVLLRVNLAVLQHKKRSLCCAGGRCTTISLP